MTEHLPECWAKHESDPPAWCICDELRACEQRVSEEQCSTCCTRAEKQYVVEFNSGRRVGYEAALDAAREAVAALDAYYALEECQGNPLEKGDPEDPDPWQQGHLIERDDALAAIDALREKKQ